MIQVAPAAAEVATNKAHQDSHQDSPQDSPQDNPREAHQITRKKIDQVLLRHNLPHPNLLPTVQMTICHFKESS